MGCTQLQLVSTDLPSTAASETPIEKELGIYPRKRNLKEWSASS